MANYKAIKYDLPAVANFSGVSVSNLSVSEAAVTAHEAALSITESQISDLGSYITASSTNTLTNKTISGAVFDTMLISQGVQESYDTKTAATGVVVHDCNNGHIFSHSSISADFTANITNLNCDTGYATTITLVLTQGGTAYMPTAVQIAGSAQTITWQGGSAPSGTSSGIDVVSFSILNASGTYTVLGSSVSYS